MGVLAIDLGSSSARVMRIGEDTGISEIGRIAHEPIKIGGFYRFDTEKLFNSVIELIDKAIDSGGVESIGICSWGVDYGLIDSAGRLVDLPISYRDDRTKEIFNARDLKADYAKSGVYPMSINTVYQLLSDINLGRLISGCRMVMIADLLAYKLTGAIRAERTNASTTGLLRADGSGWSYDFIRELGIAAELFPELIDCGEVYGEYRGVRVTAVPSHDTAAAIYAMGDMDDDTAFISSGSWILTGKVLERPIISGAAFDAGFTNERGYGNSVTFLKNSNGLFVVQRIAAETGLTYREIDNRIDSAESLGILNLAELNTPCDICGAIKKQLNLPRANALSLVKTAYDSIAAETAGTISELSEICGHKISRALLTGGMARAPYLIKKFRELSGLYVTVTDNEGAALGIARAQLEALKQAR